MKHLVQTMTSNELAFGVDGLIEESAASRGTGLLVVASVVTILALAGWSVASVLAVVYGADFSDQAFMNAFLGM